MNNQPEEKKVISREEAERKAREIAGGGFGGPATVTSFDDLASDLQNGEEPE